MEVKFKVKQVDGVDFDEKQNVFKAKLSTKIATVLRCLSMFKH